MATIISFANQKGGVGKTTTTINIGYALAKFGKKVLLVDFDPSGNLTISLGMKNPSDIDVTIANALENNVEDITSIISQKNDNLHFIPSNQDLSVTEFRLNSRTGREFTLKRVLGPIEDLYDYILIDTPPSIGLLTLNAFTCAKFVVIPMKTDFLAYKGLEALNEAITEIKEVINSELEVLGIAATLHEKSSKDDNEILSYLQEFPNYIGCVSKMVAAKKAVYDGTPIIEKSPSHRVSLQYAQIAKNILTKTKGEV